jgi:hypothetical protein
MSSGVVNVGRRPYAVGLYWENSPSGRVAQAAKEAASAPGQKAEFYAVRGSDKTGRVPQFGLGQEGVGHKAGMPVFAACLANQQGGSWVGAFRLREGVVITVVRDDLIVPDGDQLYLDEGEARDRLLQEIGFGGLQRIFAPEAWAIPGSDSMPLSLLLDERRDVRLQTVKIPKNVLIAGGVIVGLILIGIAIFLYLHAQEEKSARERDDALRRAQQAAQRLVPSQLQSNQVEYPPPERKWEKLPLPLDIVSNCEKGLAQVPVEALGWRLSTLKCDGNSVSLGWTRGNGFARPPMNSSVNDSGSMASLTISLPHMDPRGHQDLTDPNIITRRYLGENWPGTIARTADDPLPPAPPNFKGNWSPPPAPWVKRSFTVAVPVLPGSTLLFFGDLPGAVITSMTYVFGGTASGGSWTIEGTIYENRV